VGTIATAVTPLNAIVVAQIAHTERNKNASRTRNIRKQKGKTRKEENKKVSFNRRTEKATRFSKGKNSKIKNEEEQVAN